MSDAGVRTERFQIKWREVEPSRGSYDWFARDWLVGALASRGIRPAPFVWGSPTWVGNGAPARPPLDTPADIQAWQNFLRAAVARYGPGGSYWANGYRQRFGDDAVPLPVQSWQVWNEPNLKKFFAPGTTVQQSAQKYARLLSVSRDAIKGRDPQARIVNAGMPGYGDVTAWKFLNNLYQISGFKDDMDIAALHPFAVNLDELRREIDAFRTVMVNRNDRPTPLWLTELAWGSGEPDQFGLNKGLAGQNQLLRDGYRLILSRRSDWNIQRLFWFLWHDPPPGSVLCDVVQHLRHRWAGRPYPHPEARLPHVQGLHGRDHPAGGAHHRGTSKRGRDQEPDPSLLLRLERARLHLRLPRRWRFEQDLRLAVHPAAGLGRPPHLLCQGGRRPRQRERVRVAVVHRR